MPATTKIDKSWAGGNMVYVSMPTYVQKILSKFSPNFFGLKYGPLKMLKHVNHVSLGVMFTKPLTTESF